MSRLTATHRRLRSLLPSHGQPYELFDCAIFVFLIVVARYVILGAGENQEQALGFLEQAVSLTTWGIALGAMAALSAVLAYFPRWVPLGYGILAAGCFCWCAAFLLGVVLFDGTSASLISALIYAWVLRRLIAVGLRGE